MRCMRNEPWKQEFGSSPPFLFNLLQPFPDSNNSQTDEFHFLASIRLSHSLNCFSQDSYSQQSHFVPPLSQKLLHFCWKYLQAGFLHLLAPVCERLLQEIEVLENKSRLGSRVICSSPQQEWTNHRWRLFTLISQEKQAFFYSAGGSSWKLQEVQRYNLFAFLALMQDPNCLAEWIFTVSVEIWPGRQLSNERWEGADTSKPGVEMPHTKETWRGKLLECDKKFLNLPCPCDWLSVALQHAWRGQCCLLSISILVPLIAV